MVRGVLSTEAPGGCDFLSTSLLFMMVSRTQQPSRRPRRPRRPPPSHPVVFALLWLDSPSASASASALRAALDEAGLNPQSLLSRFHLTVYHAREPIPGLRPLRRTVAIDCNLAETRTMVLVPGGENPRTGVIPSQHSIALRLTTRNAWRCRRSGGSCRARYRFASPTMAVASAVLERGCEPDVPLLGLSLQAHRVRSYRRGPVEGVPALVHGHQPVEEVECTGNRWNLDTGAGIRRLNCLRLVEVNGSDLRSCTFDVGEVRSAIALFACFAGAAPPLSFGLTLGPAGPLPPSTVSETLRCAPPMPAVFGLHSIPLDCSRTAAAFAAR